MAQKVMGQEKLFAQVLDPRNRANPYPIYTQLRKTPVIQQEDGIYVVSTYHEIESLLHDPRISSDLRKSTQAARMQLGDGDTREPAFIFLDPPKHDWMRRLVMHQFTPERIEGMRDQIIHLVSSLLNAQRDRGQLDVVDDLAYPLPVTVICELLGVPREDEPLFHPWATALVRTLDPIESVNQEDAQKAQQALIQSREYMRRLIVERRAQPKDDLISGLAAGHDPDGRMNEDELQATFTMLLIAGHETTVNLITNGMLNLLRNPHVLERIRRDPNYVIYTVEELLRYDPPVHFLIRTTLADIEIAGVTIPKGASVALMLASGSHDPQRFPGADRFDPDRSDNEHLGFSGGIHICVGAPLARLETQITLSTLVRRLVNPHLVTDPPPYRESAALRGPEHLLVSFDRLAD